MVCGRDLALQYCRLVCKIGTARQSHEQAAISCTGGLRRANDRILSCSLGPVVLGVERSSARGCGETGPSQPRTCRNSTDMHEILRLRWQRQPKR
jgi:hypothetical protein